MSKGNPKIDIRLTPDLIDRLRTSAEEQGCTVSDIIRKLIIAAYGEE